MTSEFLYNLHSKRFDELSSAESEEILTDDENKPPLYTYEELRENLVVFDGRRIRNYESDQHSDEEAAGAKSPIPENIMKLSQAAADVYCKHEEKKDFEAVKKDLDIEISKLQPKKESNITIEQIHKELRKQLTKTFCYICKRQNVATEFHRHYNSGHHVTTVQKFLKAHISNLKKPIDMKYLFCEACNLPMAGNDKAINHYTTREHLKNLETFCTVCLKAIHSDFVLTHPRTKGHLKKLKNSGKPSLEKHEVESNKELEFENVQENVCASYAGALKKQECNDEQPPVIKETVKKNGDEDNFTRLSDYLKQFKRDKEKVATPESISKKFAELMGSKICKFCPNFQKMNTKHLRKLHYDNVVQWLENETAKLESPIDLALLFCDLCNLPLSGNKTALDHYDTSLHLDSVRIFCKVCCRRFPNTSMELHKQSNKHLKKLDWAVENANISSDLNTTIEEEEKMETETINKLSYNIAVKKQSGSDSDSSSKKDVTIPDPKPIKQYQQLATYVLRFVDQLYCYVCNVPAASPQHYKSQNHNVAIRKWLLGNSNLLELFGIQDIEELVCIGCKIVFHDSKVSESHYLSEEHKGTMKTFCKKCLLHENTPIHKEHNKELEADALKKNKEPFVVTHIKTPSALLATNLKIMLAPSLCEVCNQEITQNNLFHYSDRNHILMVRNWLAYGMQTLQAGVDPRLIYCEACSLVLCGTPAAQAHYKQPDHLVNQPLYCSHCIFKGTPHLILQHSMSMEHKLRFDNTVSLQNMFGPGKQRPVQVPQHFANSLIGQKLIYYPPRFPLINGPIANQAGLRLIMPNSNMSKFRDLLAQRALANDAEENRLRIQLDCEVNRLLELLYCSRRPPLKEAVSYLSVVNQKLIERM